MMPVLLRPRETIDPSQASTWAYYGAVQLFDMIGLSYTILDPSDAYDDALVIAPASNAICVNSRPMTHPPAQSTLSLLRPELEVKWWPEHDNRTANNEHSLPVFGGPFELEGEAPYGRLRNMTNGMDEGPLCVKRRTKTRGWELLFNAPVFATIGLYLSRFSWAENPGYKGFVRFIDLLWQALPEHWRRRPVVSEYGALFREIFNDCFEILGLPMATRWAHPAIEGEVKHHGLLVTHDVDAVYAEKQFRGETNQSQNDYFNFEKWKELETSLGVKSAFYFFSPSPEQHYWTDTQYLLTDPVVKRAATDLMARGWEVAHHALGYRNPEEVHAEIAHFRAVTGHTPAGTRNHVLKNVPLSLKHKADAGLRYDTTWYAEQTETNFLCGTVLPFAPLDTATGEHLKLWELPFVVEDGVVFGVYGKGGARSTEEAVQNGTRGLQHVLKNHGYVCFNWHQRTFARMSTYEGAPDNWVTALGHLAQYFQQNSPRWWNPSPAQLADFWTRRQNIQIDIRPDTITVFNSGSEDCPDFVLQLQCERKAAPSDAEVLPGDDQARGAFLLPVPVAAKETKIIKTRG